MSSTYDAICLDHSPPLEICDWRTNTPEEALRAAEDVHSTCDVMVGRYSYPLIAVGCPPGRENRCYHSRNIQWVDSEWLLIASLTVDVADDSMQRALAELDNPGCFDRQTLRRLRPLLEWRLNR